MNDADWVNIVPPPGADVAETARALLALAHVPTHVRTDGNGNEFRVPQYLADLYINPPKPPARRRKKEEGDE